MRTVMLLAAAMLAACCIVSVNGHAYLQTPRSRVMASGRADWEAAGGNGLGLRPFRTDARGVINDAADVCGDPHQDVSAYPGGDMNMRNTVTAIQATYSPGQTISVTFKMNSNHGGYFSVRLCPSTRTNPSQSCFDSYILTNADTGYQRWWIMSNTGNTATSMTTNWRLPAGISCDGGCVLQMLYKTGNSCIDACDAAECGSGYAARYNPAGAGPLQTCSSTSVRGELFRDCADIRITGSSVTPISGNPCDKCNLAVSQGGCKCDNNCNCITTSTNHCDKCNLAVSLGGCKCDNNCNCITTSGTTCPSGGGCGSNGSNCKCPSGQCCSQYGWCGTTSAHCGTGCQTTFGTCTTSG